MYLSRLILNPKSRAVRHDLADCQGLHRTLLRAFPARTERTSGARESFGVLYRLETDRVTGLPRMYVQSLEKPDWSRLPKDFLLEATEPKPLDDKYERLSDGMVLRFTLKANPTRKTGTSLKSQRLAGLKENGRRIFISRPEDQIEWLRRKGVQGGFELVSVRVNPDVPDVDVRPDNKVRGRRRSEQNDSLQELTFGSVVFEGHLRITDATAFRETLKKGIGSGKAYGFGLLSIALPR
ncbi:MAG: type I-E CRISPR-associated protein Cas6/Cse3/CasE [Bacillota bacterium]